MKFYFERRDAAFLKANIPKASDVWAKARRSLCEQAYPPKLRWKFPSPFDSSGSIREELWDEILRSIKKEAGPGVDLCYEYKTNADVLADGGEMLKKRVEDRIKRRLSIDPAVLESLVMQSRSGEDVEVHAGIGLDLISENLISPTRVFCKNEATKKSKETRIINSCSLEDSCIERVTTLLRASRFVDVWGDGPSSVGIQLKDVQALREFRWKVEGRFSSKVDHSDIQGYEYGFGELPHKMAFDIEFWMESGEFYDDVSRPLTPVEHLLVVDYYLSLLPRILVFSDGVVAVANKVWLQSGRFKTSFWGTHVRSMLCSLVELVVTGWSPAKGQPQYLPATANGDDCLNKSSEARVGQKTYFEDTVNGYEQCGFVLTDLVTSTGESPWDFCSHIITRETHYPASCTKTILQLFRNKQITEELFDAFMFVNKDRSDIVEIRNFVMSLAGENQPRIQAPPDA